MHNGQPKTIMHNGLKWRGVEGNRVEDQSPLKENTNEGVDSKEDINQLSATKSMQLNLTNCGGLSLQEKPTRR